MDENNDEYKIKVKDINIEKQNINKFNNNKIENIPFKKSILYTLKFNPEIIINQFHQTSNNINTNINIKKHQSKNSEIISRNNKNIFDDNNNSYNDSYYNNYHSYDYDNEKEDQNEYIYNKTYTNINRNKKNFKMLEDDLVNLNKKSNPLTSRINQYNSNTFYQTRTPYIKNIKFNHLQKPKIKISDYIMPSQTEEIKISKFERPKTDRKINKFNINNNDLIEKEIYSNERNKLIKKNRHLSQEEIIIPTDDFMSNENRNNSININKYNNNTVSEGFNSNRNMRIKVKKKIFINIDNDKNRYSFDKIDNQTEKKINNSNIISLNREALNLKLMNYRIKLFKQFYIHFDKYYKYYLRKYKGIFFKKIKYFFTLNEHDITYNKKSRNNKDNNGYFASHKVNTKNSLLEINKFSTTNDFYYFNKNKYINKEIKSSLINNPNKDEENFNTSQNEFSKNILSSTSRNNIKNNDTNCFSDRKYRINKNLLDSIIKSPSIKLGSETILNDELSFGKFNNEKEKEKELFRSIEELNKKEQQIIRRKKSKNERNKCLLNVVSNKNINKEKKINKIKDSKEYNQFSALRKNIKKENNNINKGKINNLKNTNLALKLDYKYNKTFYNYHSKKIKEQNTNNSINDYKKNKISNLKQFKYNYIKKSNKTNIKINNNINLFKKPKMNNNNKLLMNEKKFKNNKINKLTNDKNKFQTNEVKTSIEKEKDLKVENVPINIYKSQNNSVNLINNFNIRNKVKDKEIKMKQRLSSIKEEELSFQNSKLLEEYVTSFNLNNTNIKNNYEKNIIMKFINTIETILISIYKRILFYRMKTINIVTKMNEIFFNNQKKNAVHRKNKSQIYVRKRGILKSQKEIKTTNKGNKIDIK